MRYGLVVFTACLMLLGACAAPTEMDAERKLIASRSRTENIQLADAYYNTGSILYMQGQYDEAESYFKKLALIHETLYGQQSPLLAEDYLMLGYIAHNQEQYNEANTYLTRAMSIFKEKPGPESIKAAHVHIAFGQLHQAQKQYLEAEAAYRKSLGILKNLAGDESAKVTLATLEAMGRLYEETNRPNDAARLEEERVKLQKSMVSPKPNTP